MGQTGIVSDPLFIKHDPGPGHPECPDRLVSIYSLIESERIVERTRAVAPRPGTPEEICRIHTPEYYQRVEKTDGRSVSLDPDTSTSPDSFRAAELAVGGTLALTEAVVDGSLSNGYALIRPPGHHAERARAMGFCLFNNVAIAAEHARQTLGVERVLVVDWDLHHGNGSMHSFYQSKEIMYFSTHQFPYYPGTGAFEDVGQDAGEGFTVNVPLVPGMGDQEYRAVFRRVLAPIARQFAPELILVSTGFDTYFRDPLGGMKMTAEGYGALTAELMEMADESAQGRLVMALEGGYNLEGLSTGVSCCLKTLMGEWQPEPYQDDPGHAEKFIEVARKVQSRFWDL